MNTNPATNAATYAAENIAEDVDMSDDEETTALEEVLNRVRKILISYHLIFFKTFFLK